MVQLLAHLTDKCFVVGLKIGQRLAALADSFKHSCSDVSGI